MYIFEDCDERHATDNTYEWCAEGIVPEIDELQNVDMEVIDWWYEAFSKGENIIISDIEDIKDEHRISYDMLKEQKVKNLVVCPLRYNDEIKGFVGVDNPPKSDFVGLTTFLDMIGTFLISLMKMRNTFRKSNREAWLRSYSSLAKIYISMYLVNIQTQMYHIVKATKPVMEYLGKDIQDLESYEIEDNFCGCISRIVDQFCEESQCEKMQEFVDISTLEKRLRGKNTVVHEFIDKAAGWCRGRYIPVDYADDGRLLHVLFCVEEINEEKNRENRLLYLARTDLMTGICNRGSGEEKISSLLSEKTAGLLCLLDCNKFKAINDTYGHAVGDKVLIAVAETLQSSCREDDVIMRLGGDEFAIFIPGMTNQDSAERFFGRLFENVGQVDIPEMHGKHIVLSLGACFYDGKESVTFDQLYRKADSAMYQSKNKPENSATIYG